MRIISSACAFSVFISPTHFIGSLAFSASVTPADFISSGIICSSRLFAASSISRRWGYFLKETRRNGNYALQELNWGADFMDPETWADPFDHKNSYNFFCNETLEQDGINQYTKTEETAALIDQYFELVAAAREETGDMDARYEAFAAAESFYIDHAIVVPGFISGGSYQATKLNAFEGQYAMMGQSSSRYKGQHVYKTAMSQDMFDAQYAEWTAAMEG